VNTTWFVAKYMSDLRRREPTNVGVVLIAAHGAAFARFKGEDDATGEVDGRRIRTGSLENYKAWVAHWRRTIERNPDPVRLAKRDPSQNYFLEFGGERLVGNEETDPRQLLDLLYRELVEENPPLVEALDPRRLVERTFVRLHIREKITERPAVVGRRWGVDDPLSFDYRYKNGVNVLMKRVHISKEWDAVHAAAWNFQQARLAEPDTRLVSLISHAPGTDPEDPVKILRKVGSDETVDVSDEGRAISGLQTALQLKLLPPVS
jgi:hypothetical protein